MYKVIILGAPLTGKTTLINYLRDSLQLPVLDMDKEILRLNGGKWPTNGSELSGRLVKQVIGDILARQEVIAAVFYFGIKELRQARSKGFEIIQFEVAKTLAVQRNQQRLKLEPGNDAFNYYDENVKYQMEIRKQGLVDRIIKTNMPVEQIAQELLHSEPMG